MTTVEKILDKIDRAIKMVDSNSLEYNPEMNINDIEFEDEEVDGLIFGENIKVLLQDMDLIKWRQDLMGDKEKLSSILQEAKKITPERDAKLRELQEMIKFKIDNPINTGNKKVLIFTAFADTANYLYDNLADVLQEQNIYTAMVTGSGKNRSTLPIPKEMRNKVKISDLNTVLTLFSPKSKECDKVFPEKEDGIDILIATDCISEGQNLQDCDFLINYDIHWNPVRIIQRFGRIDRIGSKNECIQLVNFWPMEDLDAYINLQQRVKGRMVLLDVSATGDENVIEDDGNQE